MTAPQTPSQVLRAARKLIETPENWTTETEARDIFGASIASDSGDAVCWCALGAVECVAIPNWSLIDRANRILREAVGGGLVGDWNDNPHRLHAEVLSGFDRAIALAEQAGQ